MPKIELPARWIKEGWPKYKKKYAKPGSQFAKLIKTPQQGAIHLLRNGVFEGRHVKGVTLPNNGGGINPPATPPPSPGGYSKHHNRKNFPIKDFIFDFNTWQQQANREPETDNFPMCWARDGHHYTMGGDGCGWQGSGKKSLSLHRISGNAPGNGLDLWSGNGKSYGIEAVDGNLYAFRGPGSGSDSLAYVEMYRFNLAGKLLGTSKLWSWTGDLAHNPVMPTWFTMGKNQQFAFDGYLYGIAPSATKYKWEIWETDMLAGYPDDKGIILLFRVPRNKVMNKGAYQWWNGKTWVAKRSQSKYVALLDKVSVVSATYLPGPNRYVVMSEHSHQQRGNLQIWDAPRPWGPYRRVDRINGFGNGKFEKSTFFWSIAPGWVKGHKGTMVFTGVRSMDAYNTANFSMVY